VETEKYWCNISLFTDWEFHYQYWIAFCDTLELSDKNKILKAIETVKRYHDEQRMDGIGNMNVHLLRVARVVVEEIGIEDLDSILVAFFHDILEDTAYPEKGILLDFGENVFSGVKLLTRPREIDRKVYSDEVVASGDLSVIKVKIADKLDNLRSHFHSKNTDMREKNYRKTLDIMYPIIKKYYPEILPKFDEIITIW
jgi:(p)ppGpp synthase/HD superfamily hydrolase